MFTSAVESVTDKIAQWTGSNIDTPIEADEEDSDDEEAVKSVSSVSIALPTEYHQIGHQPGTISTTRSSSRPLVNMKPPRLEKTASTGLRVLAILKTALAARINMGDKILSMHKDACKDTGIVSPFKKATYVEYTEMALANVDFLIVETTVAQEFDAMCQKGAYGIMIADVVESASALKFDENRLDLIHAIYQLPYAPMYIQTAASDILGILESKHWFKT